MGKKKPIQPDDVKINTNINALKEIIKKIMAFPSHSLYGNDDNVIYCVDGHTKKALKELKHEGKTYRIN